MERGAWRAVVHWVTKEPDTTEQLNYKVLKVVPGTQKIQKKI